MVAVCAGGVSASVRCSRTLAPAAVLPFRACMSLLWTLREVDHVSLGGLALVTRRSHPPKRERRLRTATLTNRSSGVRGAGPFEVTSGGFVEGVARMRTEPPGLAIKASVGNADRPLRCLRSHMGTE